MNFQHTLLNDIIFKIVFASPGSEPILLSLVNAVLQRPVDKQLVHLELVNPVSLKSFAEEKQTVLDLKASDASGQLIYVELQLQLQDFFLSRSIYYLCEVVCDQLQRGECYSRLQPSIGINLVNFRLFPDDERLHRRAFLHDQESDQRLSDLLELHFVELPKFGLRSTVEDPLSNWLHLLKYSHRYPDSRDLPPALLEQEEIIMAHDSMKRAYATDDVQELLKAQRHYRYLRNSELHEAESRGLRQGEELGLSKGRELGRSEGKELGRSEGMTIANVRMAARMREQGYSAEQILSLTSLRPGEY